ncbi:MAG: peroxidase family protein [Pseudomonadota bacterium]
MSKPVQKILDFLIRLVLKSETLTRWVNRFMINKIVTVCRARPHPMSTAHDYVSWKGLTDRRFSSRHLPPDTGVPTPELDQMMGLFKRDDGQKLCPYSSCLFPAFAQYLTDGFIRTQDREEDGDFSVTRMNTSNHEIDLCPLYGRTEEQTNVLRLKSEQDGQKGRLKSQLINGEEYALFLKSGGQTKPEFLRSDGTPILDEPLGQSNLTDTAQLDRLFAFGGDRANSVPQVAMMNTLFLREHNRVAGALEARNAHWDDDRVFETARNITIVMFIKMVVEDYINHIAPSAFTFKADPSVAWHARWNKPNWISTEFSLLYRWHALIPDALIWGGTEVPLPQTFMENKHLLDHGMMAGFRDMSATRAGAVGPRNTADALLHVEQASIQQGRAVALAPYSDYRHYVGLKRPYSFDEISSDTTVQTILKDLYGSPKDVEFFVGLFCEDRVDGSPLPPLILRMVAVDAFSQALTNPLLSEHVYNWRTFTKWGLDEIEHTSKLRDILARNVPNFDETAHVAMQRPGLAA